jgi:hypothetical protein
LARKKKRLRPPKDVPYSAYHTVFRIVDGAVKDAFNNHPEYVRPEIERVVRMSITKRVTGSIIKYAREVRKELAEEARGEPGEPGT